MINSLQWADIETIQYHLSLQFIPILLDMVVLHHDYHQIYVLQEIIEVAKLIFGDFMIFQEWIIAFQWSRQMTFLRLQEL